MPVKTTQIPPYSLPESPPPTFPMLIAHTGLGVSRTCQSVSLVASEELPPIRAIQVKRVKFEPESRSVTLTSQYDAPTPRYDTPTPASMKSRSTSPNDSDSVCSSILSETESLADSNSDNGKIPKPEGEVGRPGRGGYNLKVAMGWSKEDFNTLHKHVSKLINHHLDGTKAFSEQNNKLLRVVCTKARDKFPRLEDFCDEWPVIDMCKLRLKYTASRERRKEQKLAAGKNLKADRSAKVMRAKSS